MLLLLATLPSPNDSLENSNVRPSSSVVLPWWLSNSLSDNESSEMAEVLGRMRDAPGDFVLGDSVEASDW